MTKNELRDIANIILTDLLSKNNIATVTKSAPVFIAPLISMLDSQTIITGLLELIPPDTTDKVENALYRMGYKHGYNNQSC